ncbi:MAG: hypothetical protein B7Z73_08295, partial [Planctomycetia bacterium 21-64-5]
MEAAEVVPLGQRGGKPLERGDHFILVPGRRCQRRRDRACVRRRGRGFLGRAGRQLDLRRLDRRRQLAADGRQLVAAQTVDLVEQRSHLPLDVRAVDVVLLQIGEQPGNLTRHAFAGAGEPALDLPLQQFGALQVVDVVPLQAADLPQLDVGIGQRRPGVALELQQRAARVGFDWRQLPPVLAKIRE